MEGDPRVDKFMQILFHPVDKSYSPHTHPFRVHKSLHVLMYDACLVAPIQRFLSPWPDYLTCQWCSLC